MVGEIMGESIKSAISLKIKNNFTTINGKPPIIYKEQMVQGMKKPSFFIWQMDVSQEKLFGKNYERIYQMNIRYHPEDKDLKRYETLADIGNKLLEYLAYIEIPIITKYDDKGNPIEEMKPVKGSQMSFKIVDNILQVFVTYVIRMKLKETQPPFMQQLFINSIGINTPDLSIAGEYVTGVVGILADRQIMVNGVLIPQNKINYSLLVSDTLLWEGLKNGDEVILLHSSDDEYFVIDTKTNRLKTDLLIDGGEF